MFVGRHRTQDSGPTGTRTRDQVDYSSDGTDDDHEKRSRCSEMEGTTFGPVGDGVKVHEIVLFRSVGRVGRV